LGKEISGERDDDDDFAEENGDVVRIAFAGVLGDLGIVAKRFLDVMQATRCVSMYDDNEKEEASEDEKETKKNMPFKLPTSPYTDALDKLRKRISTYFLQLALSPDRPKGGSGGSGGGFSNGLGGVEAPMHKLALLATLPSLSTFFTPSHIPTVILPIIITFLSSPNAALRTRFCENLPSGVCSFIGRRDTEMFVVPCLENALVDVDQRVVAASVTAVSELIELGLLGKTKQVSERRAEQCEATAT